MSRRTTAAAAAAIIMAAGWLCQCRSGPALQTHKQPPPVIMAVSGASVRVETMHSTVRLLGKTVALRHIMIRAPTAGRVLGLNLQTGDRVTRGEVVAHVLSREVEAAQHGLAVARQLDRTEAKRLADSVNRYIHGAGVAVTSPDNAVVAQRLVSSGQMVSDLEPLADLIDPRSVFVDAALPIDDFAAVRPGMAARVSSPLRPGFVYPAQVAAISPTFSQGGTASSARIEFTGNERLGQAGAPVEAEVTTQVVRNALVVPSAALFADAANQSFYVFVAGADGRAHRTLVTPGIRQPPEVQITSGLRPGAVVITSGGYALSDGLRVQVTQEAQ